MVSNTHFRPYLPLAMTNTHGRWINFDVFPMRELCISFLGCFGAVIEVFVGVFSPGFISSIQ